MIRSPLDRCVRKAKTDGPTQNTRGKKNIAGMASPSVENPAMQQENIDGDGLAAVDGMIEKLQKVSFFCS